MKGIAEFKVGERVQLHPATDLWMRGARFGEVTAIRWHPRRGAHTFVVRLDVNGNKVSLDAGNLISAS